MRKVLSAGSEIALGTFRQHVAVTLVALLLLSAGCATLVNEDSADDSAPLNDIPAEADGLVHVQTAVLTDSVTETVVNEGLQTDIVNETNNDWEAWEEAIAMSENETNISIDDIHSVTTFTGSISDPEQVYAGTIVKSDLDWETLNESLDNETEIEETSYNGVTVYTGDEEMLDDSSWVADLGDGTFAFGSEAAVKDVIDTRDGDEPGIDSELERLYEETTNGYARGAFVLSDEDSEAADDSGSEESGLGGLFAPDAQAVTMSYHTEDDQLNLETDITFNSSEDADAFAGFAGLLVDPPSVDDDADPADNPIDFLFASTTLNSTENRVSLAFRAGPEELVTAFDAVNESDAALPGVFSTVPVDQSVASD